MDFTELASQVHLVILHDLLDTVLRVADEVEELMVKHVSFTLLALLQSVELVQIRLSFAILYLA